MNLHISLVQKNTENGRKIAFFTDDQGQYTQKSIRDGLKLIGGYLYIIVWKRSNIKMIAVYIKEVLELCQTKQRMEFDQWGSVSISTGSLDIEIMCRWLTSFFNRHLSNFLGIEDKKSDRWITGNIEDISIKGSYHQKKISGELAKHQGDSNLLIFHEAEEGPLQPGCYNPTDFKQEILRNIRLPQLMAKIFLDYKLILESQNKEKCIINWHKNKEADQKNATSLYCMLQTNSDVMPMARSCL